MSRILKLAMAVLVPMLVVGFGATRDAQARKPFPMLHKLIKAGAIEKGDLDAVIALRKEFKACKKSDHKEGACRPKRIEQVKAQVSLLEKAIAKVEKKKLKKAAKKALKKLKRRLRRLEKKEAAAGGAGSGSASGSAS